MSCTPFSRQFRTGLSAQSTLWGKRTKPARDPVRSNGYRRGARTGAERDTGPSCGNQRSAENTSSSSKIHVEIRHENRETGTARPGSDADSTKTLVLHCCTGRNGSCSPVVVFPRPSLTTLQSAAVYYKHSPAEARNYDCRMPSKQISGTINWKPLSRTYLAFSTGSTFRYK